MNEGTRRKMAKQISRMSPASCLPRTRQFLAIARAAQMASKNAAISPHALWAMAIAHRLNARFDQQRRPSLTDLASSHARAHRHRIVRNLFASSSVQQVFSPRRGAGLRSRTAERRTEARHTNQFLVRNNVTRFSTKNYSFSLAGFRWAGLRAVEAGKAAYRPQTGAAISPRVATLADQHGSGHHAEASPVEELARKITRQHERHESGHARTAGALATDVSVPRTNRPLPALVQSFVPSSGRRRRMEPIENGVAERRRAPVSASPVNVSQIADEVVKQLDRRLVSARERLGRI
jgi:hypothetical protein